MDLGLHRALFVIQSPLDFQRFGAMMSNKADHAVVAVQEYTEHTRIELERELASISSTSSEEAINRRASKAHADAAQCLIGKKIYMSDGVTITGHSFSGPFHVMTVEEFKDATVDTTTAVILGGFSLDPVSHEADERESKIAITKDTFVQYI